MAAPSLDRVIRKPELLRITGVSIATIYRWIGEGNFPAPVKLGPNSTGWRESDVRAWLDSRELVGAPASAEPNESPNVGSQGRHLPKEADR